MGYEAAQELERKREVLEALALKLKKSPRYRELQDLLDVLVEEAVTRSFIKKKNQGIVSDPGYDFLRNPARITPLHPRQ